MSDHAKERGRGWAAASTAGTALACFAAGLGAGLAGAWLLSAAPPSAPPALPQAPPAAAPVAVADVPPASAEALLRLADIQSLPADFGRALALHLFDDERGVADIERLLDQAGDLRHASDRAAALSILYARYGELDPAAALRHVQGRGRQGLGYAADRWLGSIFGAWARSDLDAALLHAETLNPHQRPAVGAAILRARDDLPQAARAEIAARLGRRDLVVQFARGDGSVADDPAGAWRQALAQRAGSARMVDLRHVIEQWAATNPLAALDAIEAAAGVKPSRRTALRSNVMRSWADADPTAALEWAAAQPASRSRRRMVGIALDAWAESDPRAAAQWLNAPANRTVGGHALRAVAKNYAARHPEEAADWALALPADQASQALDIVFATRVSELSLDDPERAAQLLPRIGSADALRAAENALLYGWRDDPDAAMAWLDQLADADRRTALYAMLFQRLFIEDPTGTIGRLDRLTDPRTHDGAVLAIIHDVMGAGVVSIAEMLLERLDTEAARREAMATLYKHLREIDPERAERYR